MLMRLHNAYQSREAHPERGDRYERQIFACQKCGNTATREVFTPDAAKAKG
jgi:ribosomal protein L37AE/L43A